jgi:hypothetical protein
MPPENVAARQARAQDPHILRALGRAWAWRRRLESGEVATAGDLAKLEGVTERFVSRTMRLAYLAPDVLEQLLLMRQSPAVSGHDLVSVSSAPWRDQPARIFGCGYLHPFHGLSFSGVPPIPETTFSDAVRNTS